MTLRNALLKALPFALVLCVVSGCGTVDLGDNSQGRPQAIDTTPTSRLENPKMVTRVVDGDTIDVILDGTVDGVYSRIRMKGINTPELHPNPPGSPVEPCAEAARDFTRAHVGTHVDIIYDSACPPPHSASACTGSFGRVLAYVRLSDGSDLGARLLELGLSKVYTAAGSFDRDSAYQTIAQGAREAGKGIWGDQCLQ